MKNLKSRILFVLASLPLGLVSFAARSAYQDSHDVESLRSFQNNLRAQRPLVFENGEMLSSVSDSYGRFLAKSAPDAQVDQAEFMKLLAAMESKGLLQRQGEILLACIPSAY